MLYFFLVKLYKLFLIFKFILLRLQKREDLLEEAEDETSDSLSLPQTNTSNVPAKTIKPNVVTNNNISSPDLKLPFKARVSVTVYV